MNFIIYSNPRREGHYLTFCYTCSHGSSWANHVVASWLERLAHSLYFVRLSSFPFNFRFDKSCDLQDNIVYTEYDDVRITCDLQICNREANLAGSHNGMPCDSSMALTRLQRTFFICRALAYCRFTVTFFKACESTREEATSWPREI